MPVFMRKCKTCGKKFRTRNADEYTCPKHTVSFSVKVIEPTEKEKRMMDAVRMFAARAASDTKAASAPAKKKPLPDCTIEIPMPLTGDGSLVSGLILDKMRANDAARAKRQKEKVAAKPAPTNSAKPEEVLTAIANAKLAGRNATVVVKRGRGRPRKVYTGRITSVTVTSTPVTKPRKRKTPTSCRRAASPRVRRPTTTYTPRLRSSATRSTSAFRPPRSYARCRHAASGSFARETSKSVVALRT